MPQDPPHTHREEGADGVVFDPRVILAGMFSVAIWINTSGTPAGAVIWALMLVGSILVLRGRLGRRMPGYPRLIVWSLVMGVVTVGFYLVFRSPDAGLRGSPEWWRFDPGVVLTGTRMGLRLFAFVLLGMTVAALSSPLSLALGLTRLLRPLRNLGVPVETVYYFAFFLLRMVPFLVAEARTIRLAQASRGVRAGGRRGAGIRGAASLAIPVLAAAGRRSERLSIALASRGFDVRRFPVAAQALRFGPRDRVAAVLILGGWGVWLVMRYYPGEWSMP